MKPWCSRRTSLIFPVVTLEKGFSASFFDVAVTCHFGTCCCFCPRLLPIYDVRCLCLAYVYSLLGIYIYSLRGFSKLLRDKIKRCRQHKISGVVHLIDDRAELSCGRAWSRNYGPPLFDIHESGWQTFCQQCAKTLQK